MPVGTTGWFPMIFTHILSLCSTPEYHILVDFSPYPCNNQEISYKDGYHDRCRGTWHMWRRSLLSMEIPECVQSRCVWSTSIQSMSIQSTSVQRTSLTHVGSSDLLAQQHCRSVGTSVLREGGNAMWMAVRGPTLCNPVCVCMCVLGG